MPCAKARGERATSRSMNAINGQSVVCSASARASASRRWSTSTRRRTASNATPNAAPLHACTPHPRAAVKQLPAVLEGRRLESVHAVGKNLLLRFEGGVVLRNHMRMKGRWRVLPRDAEIYGTPWLVLRGEQHVGVLSGGAVLELDHGEPLRVGPDILGEPPDFDAMLRNLRAAEQS